MRLVFQRSRGARLFQHHRT